MPKYNYVAMDSRGKETKGTLEVASQNEAIGRVKEMGFFPTKIVEADKAQDKKAAAKRPRPRPPAKGGKKKGAMNINIKIPGLSGGVKPKVLTTFTRQLATLVDAGLPLLRGLRVLEKQERNANAEKHPRRTRAVHRRRQHFFRRPGAASQGFQPSVREHGQGRRTGRCARSRAETARGIHGKGAEDQRQGQRRHVLSRAPS